MLLHNKGFLEMSQKQDSAAPIPAPTILEPSSLGTAATNNLLPWGSAKRTLAGIKAAVLKDGDDEVKQKRVTRVTDSIASWLSEQEEVRPKSPLSVDEMFHAAKSRFEAQTDESLLLNLLIGIAYLRQRNAATVTGEANVGPDLDFVWPIIHAAVSQTHLFRSYRSAGGFFHVPICSLIVEGAINELWRVHVWLDDGFRTKEGFRCHQHNTDGTGWILFGRGVDHRFEVVDKDTEAEAEHAKFELYFGDEHLTDAKYKTHQTQSVVRNSGKFASVTSESEQIYTRNMTYTVPQGAWHDSRVPGNEKHATLFFFDGRKSCGPAPILGPKAEQFSVSTKDAGDGNTPEYVIDIVSRERHNEAIKSK